MGKGREQRIVFGLGREGAAQRVAAEVPGLSLSVCEAMGKSGDLECLVHQEGEQGVCSITSVAKCQHPKGQNALTLGLSAPEGLIAVSS